MSVMTNFTAADMPGAPAPAIVVEEAPKKKASKKTEKAPAVAETTPVEEPAAGEAVEPAEEVAED